MKQIVVEYAKSTGFDPFFNSIGKGSVITIQDEPFAGGGFGDVYHAISFDGVISPLKQVVKVFKDDRNDHGWRTISELQDAIIKKREDIESCGAAFLARHPSFIGFPQLIFKGSLGKRKVMGHVTVDLTAIGCTSLDRILPLGYDGKNDRKKFLSCKTLDRAVMAYQLADCFSVLHQIHYIHADITPDNIMVNLSEPICAVIDYDSGVIVKNQKDNPITYGKAGGDWTPPELQFEILENGFGKISINQYMDLWSIAAAIHNLIYGFPHLFLANLTRPSYEAFVSKYPNWPDIDVNDPLVNPQSKDSYLFYRNQVIDGIGLRKQTLDAFRLTFTKGIFDSSFRTSAEEWGRLLEKEIGTSYLSKVKVPSWATNKAVINKSAKDQKKVKENPDQGTKVPTQKVLNKKLPPKQDSKKLFEDLMRDLTSDILKDNNLKLQTHRPMIVKYANAAGLNGEDVAKNFEELLKKHKELLDKGGVKNNSDKYLLRYLASLTHANLTDILGI